MQGLAHNKYQFGLLILVNAFVGAMVGLERAVIPGPAKSKFGIEANTAVFYLLQLLA